MQQRVQLLLHLVFFYMYVNFRTDGHAVLLLLHIHVMLPQSKSTQLHTVHGTHCSSCPQAA
jgi:hypothetical protein